MPDIALRKPIRSFYTATAKESIVKITPSIHPFRHRVSFMQL